MKDWRKQLSRLLEETPASRPAALRRSLKPDWLYCTDLPACAPPESCEAFRAGAERLGWETEREGGWIQARRRGGTLPADWPGPEASGPEADCLRSLRNRHPELHLSAQEEMLIAKAEEEDPAKTEAACKAVHARWAALLRERGRSRTAEAAKAPEKGPPFKSPAGENAGDGAAV